MLASVTKWGRFMGGDTYDRMCVRGGGRCVSVNLPILSLIQKKLQHVLKMIELWLKVPRLHLHGTKSGSITH